MYFTVKFTPRCGVSQNNDWRVPPQKSKSVAGATCTNFELALAHCDLAEEGLSRGNEHSTSFSFCSDSVLASSYVFFQSYIFLSGLKSIEPCVHGRILYLVWCAPRSGSPHAEGACGLTRSRRGALS